VRRLALEKRESRFGKVHNVLQVFRFAAWRKRNNNQASAHGAQISSNPKERIITEEQNSIAFASAVFKQETGNGGARGLKLTVRVSPFQG
jgi:hypothetical protein